jgi:hypothetical protein
MPLMIVLKSDPVGAGAGWGAGAVESGVSMVTLT